MAELPADIVRERHALLAQMADLANMLQTDPWIMNAVKRADAEAAVRAAADQVRAARTAAGTSG